MNAEIFERAYTSLNPGQKEAVDTIDGPVMVIAGPGTGKTQILTLRIANILKKTDAPAGSILALTFTEAAAANMRKRLVNMIGTKGYYVEISTFHGFCNRIIQEYPERFPRIIGATNATGAHQAAMMREVIDALDILVLKPMGDKFYRVPEILSAIRTAKREGVSVEILEEKIKTWEEEVSGVPDLYHESGAHKGKMKSDYKKEFESIEKNKELVQIYRAYEEKLAERRLYDFEDMILEVIQALQKDEQFLLELEERYQYILVDEHQDTNGAQNKLLELLTSYFPNPNLFVVGDEKQAIFRFQGASLDNFLYFKNKYTSARLIELKENYRSTQSIIDSAESVIGNNKVKLSGSLTAKRGLPEKNIEIYECKNRETELHFLKAKILEKIQAGIEPEEIAVIYRENKEAFRIADFFDREGIAYSVESDENILSDIDIQKFIMLLRALALFGANELCARIIHFQEFQISPIDAYTIIQYAEKKRIPIAKIITGKGYIESLELENKETVIALGEKLQAWKRASENEAFLYFFERVLKESGILDHCLSTKNHFEKLEKFHILFEEIRNEVGMKKEYSLQDFLKYIEVLEAHGIPLQARMRRKPHTIRLMTAHRSKGLEFQIVFITRVIDGIWGNRRAHGGIKLPIHTLTPQDEMEENEDERRLFFMALTRAKEEVCVSYPLTREDGREVVPSLFIQEIRDDKKTTCKTDTYEAHAEEARRVFAVQREEERDREKEKLFLNELFFDRGISPTALNNYLACPWRYFYQNLLRIPGMPTIHQMYGTAVHYALQRFFEAKKSGADVSDKDIVLWFSEHIERNPLSEVDISRLIKKGTETLTSYYKNYKDTWNYRTETEIPIKGIELREDILLTGKLDKLEIQEDGKSVIVVDYKTKQPESRNVLEGKTKNATGNEKRQLTFYKLLLDMHPEKKYIMKGGEIDFIEPNDQGKFKKEFFEIQNEEVEELKKVIIKMADEVHALSFWNTRCEDKECEFCKLRDMIEGDEKHMV